MFHRFHDPIAFIQRQLQQKEAAMPRLKVADKVVWQVAGHPDCHGEITKIRGDSAYVVFETANGQFTGGHWIDLSQLIKEGTDAHG